MGKQFFTLGRGFRLDIIINSTVGLIGIFALFMLLNDQWLRRFIPIQTKDLNPLAKVKSSKGQVVRKLLSDSLQLPLARGDKIYEDDLITTGEGSSVEIALDQGNSITTEPNTILRIRIDREKLFLKLHQGSVRTHFSSDRWVIINTGLRNQLMQIRQGTYLVKNSFSGIQITAYASQHTIKRGLASKDNQASAKAAAAIETLHQEDSDAREQAEDLKAEAEEALEETKLSLPLAFPQPEDKQVFLIQGPQILRLAARAFCLEVCELIVKKDKEVIATAHYIKGQITIFELNVEETTQGQFEWSFSDQGQNETFEFQVQPFSSENLQNNLDKGLNVEIL